MSAIAAILRRNHQEPSLAEGETMMRRLAEFPADDAGIWQEGPVFLGCRAQWVTPESVGEPMPRYDAERNLAIAADAIIDNREELFDRLDVPHRERDGMTDSELIVLAYRKWDKDAPRYMIGDYAFVIWDGHRKRLFGARDLFGNRTLYYAQNADRLAMCTTIEPLLALPGMKREIHEFWLAEFMTIPVMVESSDPFSTAYKGVNQLPPGHSVTVDGGHAAFEKYGNPAETVKLGLKSNEEYEEAFRDVFGRAVKAGLRTFRQAGTTLSGGLDSSSIAAFASRALRAEGKPLHTYSYVPSDDFVDWTDRGRAANESPYIRKTVAHVGNIRDHYLDFPGRSPLSEVDEWLRIIEFPYKFFENSFWIRGIFEQAGADNVGILFIGARGNQTISWGPVLHYYAQLLRRFRWIQFYRELQLFSRQRGIGRSRLLPMIGRHAMPRGPETSLITQEPDIPRMIHPAFAERTGVFDRLRENDEAISGFLRHDAVEARQNHIKSLAIASLRGTKGTKLSLAYNVWERDPTCDPRVVRFCLSVPTDQYVQNGVDRSLIRRATKGYLPDEVRLNQRVRGVQAADWIHRMAPHWGGFVAELRQLCKDDRMAGVLNVELLGSILNEVGDNPQPKLAFHPNVRFLMRCLIVYRFLKKHA